jgi:hypothetical protein
MTTITSADQAALRERGALAGFFGTETRQHMLDADYLSRWYPQRGAERRAYLTRIGRSSPFWLGTPAPDAAPSEPR